MLGPKGLDVEWHFSEIDLSHIRDAIQIDQNKHISCLTRLEFPSSSEDW
jgi:hypothetical protein